MVSSLSAASKFAPPPSPPRLVPRPRLASALDEGVRRPLTLVSAGPGSGKTVLLATWAATTDLPTAWLSVDPSDDHPARLWRLVGKALRAAGIVADSDDLAALPLGEPDAYQFVSAMLDALPSPAESVLVLDDAHWLTDIDVLAQLDAIIRYGLPRLHLVLATRSDPLLPLHRYRLSGQLSELRGADLAMTRPETRALLSAHSVALRAADLDLLLERTEGWLAGLRLSAMNMTGSAHPGQFVTRLAIDQGSVGEYLMEEVLARQSSDARRMLIQTSFLDEVSAPLAVAVTGIEESPDLLATLSRTNSFIVPVDHDSTRYRYHRLLREVLRYLLKREYPGAEAALRRRAAAWYTGQDQPLEAMRLAASAGAWRDAANALVHGGLAHAFTMREDIIELGMAGLPSATDRRLEAWESDSDVSLAQAAVLVAAGDVEGGKELLRQARAALSGTAKATAALVDAIAAHQTGALRELDEAAEVLLAADAEPTSAALHAAVRLTQASARYWSAESPNQIERLLLDGMQDAQRAGMPGLALECLGLLELSYVTLGRVEHAKQCAARAHEMISDNPGLERVTTHHLAQAYAAHLRMDRATVNRALRRAQHRITTDTDRPTRAGVALMSGLLLMSIGRLADAHKFLTSAPEFDPVLPRRITLYRELLLTEIEIRMGRPRAALKMLREDPTRTQSAVIALIAARAHIAMGDASAAQRCLRPALFADEGAMPLEVLVWSLLTSAAAAALTGDDVAAVDRILRACDTAADRAPQPFADAHDMLAAVLGRHPEARDRWPHPVDEPQPGTAGAPVVDQAAGPLPEPLTDRELTVLRRLATTMTTAEIAAELCVSINTVKTHIAAIYRKLPAANRREAASRGRQLELL